MFVLIGNPPVWYERRGIDIRIVSKVIVAGQAWSALLRNPVHSLLTYMYVCFKTHISNQSKNKKPRYLIYKGRCLATTT